MKFYPLILVAILFQSESLFAGTMSGGSLNMSVGQEYLADGEMVAAHEINLTCGQNFKGQGYIKAPTINITTRKFQFTGTIECDGICTITVKEPFDQTQFNRVGNGQFQIVVDESLDLEKRDSEHAMPAINPVLRTPPMIARSAFERPSIPTFAPARIERQDAPERTVKKGNLTFNFKGNGMLSLVDAVEKNDISLVKALLNDNPHIKEDIEQLTILMVLAGLDGHLDIAKECINLGANINGKDCKYGMGTSHLITAVRNNKEFAQLLIESGAQVNDEDPLWRTALHYAANNGYIDIVNALIQAGVNINKTDEHWRTALIYAADKGHLEVVRALLNAGAYTNRTDKDGLKAIDYVHATEQKELFDLLNEEKELPLSSTTENNIEKKKSAVENKCENQTIENEKAIVRSSPSSPIVKEFLKLPIQVKLISVIAAGSMIYYFYKDCKRLGWI